MEATQLDNLPVGQLLASRLPVASLGALSCASRSLAAHVDQSDGAWVARLQAQFDGGGGGAPGGAACTAPATHAAGGGKAAYARAARCALRLCTGKPAAESFSRAYNTPAPGAACLAIARGGGDGAAWAPPRAAASVDAQLWFSAPGRQRRFSGPAGHTAWVDCLVEVAPGRCARLRAGGGARSAHGGRAPATTPRGRPRRRPPCRPLPLLSGRRSSPLERLPFPRYASGARDRTVKLWSPWGPPSAPAPAAAGPSPPAAAAPAAPVRTLRGHGDSVTALLALPCGDGGGGDAEAVSSSSSGGGGGQPMVLASASLDKTVRLWSLAPLLGGGSGGGGSGGGGGSPQLAVLRGHGELASGPRWKRVARCMRRRLPLQRPPTRPSPPATTGDAVRALLRHPAEPSCLVSGARDQRAKIWDVGDGRSGSCAATIRLGGPCSFLLPLAPAGGSACVAAVLAGGVQVLDLRCGRPVLSFGAGGSGASGGASGSGGPARAGPILCAASHGCRVAAGQGRTAAAWDVRAACGGGHGGGGGGGRGPRPLFGVHHPRGRPLTSLHLDRLKLVTATAAVQLHSDASVYVWDAEDGGALRSLSSTCVGARRGAACHGAAWRDGCGSRRAGGCTPHCVGLCGRPACPQQRPPPPAHRDSPVQLQQHADPHAALFMGGDDDACEQGPPGCLLTPALFIGCGCPSHGRVLQGRGRRRPARGLGAAGPSSDPRPPSPRPQGSCSRWAAGYQLCNEQRWLLLRVPICCVNCLLPRLPPTQLPEQSGIHPESPPRSLPPRPWTPSRCRRC
jgi:WD40 repeat protein